MFRLLFALSLIGMFQNQMYGMRLLLGPTADDLLKEVRSSNNEAEKKIAVDFLDKKIDGSEFTIKISKMRADQEEKKLKEQQRQRTLKEEADGANLVKSISQGVAATKKALQAFEQTEETKLIYSWKKALFEEIVENCKNPDCPQIIQEVQKHFDIKSEAQNCFPWDARSRHTSEKTIWPPKLFQNQYALDGFLQLGVTPYSGYNYRRDLVSGSFSIADTRHGSFHPSEDCFSSCSMSYALIAGGNAVALKTILKHYPGFMTKNFLYSVAAFDRSEGFTTLSQVQPCYAHHDLLFPEFPHECIECIVPAGKLLAFCQWAQGRYNINHEHEGATVVDVLARKTLTVRSENQNAQELYAPYQDALAFLIKSGARSAQTSEILALAEEKVNIVGKRGQAYSGFISDTERKAAQASAEFKIACDLRAFLQKQLSK